MVCLVHFLPWHRDGAVDKVPVEAEGVKLLCPVGALLLVDAVWAEGGHHGQPEGAAGGREWVALVDFDADMIVDILEAEKWFVVVGLVRVDRMR